MDWTMGPADTWDALADWLSHIPVRLPGGLRTLLVVSGHSEAPVPTLTSDRSHTLLFDYYGFPPHTYELTWPAPGDQELASEAQRLLSDAGFESAGTTGRGIDHGVFVPLKVVFPDADVPVVQLSLVRGLDPASHLEIGKALLPLRDEGVLIVGSGMSYHNMNAFMTDAAAGDSAAFDAWLGSTCTAEADERRRRLIDWEAAPSARTAHPREEHLAPLFVVAGAAGRDPGAVSFRGPAMGATLSGYVFG